MKFAAAFALLAAVAAEELVEFDDSTLAGLGEDARDAALAELDQQAGIEEAMEDEENLMENAPEDEEEVDLDMEPLEFEDAEISDDEEVEVDADAEEEDLAPGVAAKIEESEDWNLGKAKKFIHDHTNVEESEDWGLGDAKKLIHQATNVQESEDWNLGKAKKFIHDHTNVEEDDEEEFNAGKLEGALKVKGEQALKEGEADLKKIEKDLVELEDQQDDDEDIEDDEAEENLPTAKAAVPLVRGMVKQINGVANGLKKNIDEIVKPVLHMNATMSDNAIKSSYKSTKAEVHRMTA